MSSVASARIGSRPALVLVLSIAALVGAGACDGGPPPNVAGVDGTAGASGGAAAPGTRKSAVIAIEPRRAGVRQFPLPIVDGRIGDKPVKLVISTGAATHVIDRSLGVDANAKISVEGWGDVPAHAAEIADLPPHVKNHGVGGILSPQLLVEQGQAVVVDLVNKQMRLRPKTMGWSEVGDIGAKLTPSGQAHSCATEAAGAPGQLLVVDAQIEGVAQKLSLDTGASRTILLEGSPAAAKAAAHDVLGRSVAPGVRGNVATPLHGGVPITAGSWSTTVDMGIAPGEKHPQCGHEGHIGVDVLAYCALAIASDDVLVACRKPGE